MTAPYPTDCGQCSDRLSSVGVCQV